MVRGFVVVQGIEEKFLTAQAVALGLKILCGRARIGRFNLVQRGRADLNLIGNGTVGRSSGGGKRQHCRQEGDDQGSYARHGSTSENGQLSRRSTPPQGAVQERARSRGFY